MRPRMLALSLVVTALAPGARAADEAKANGGKWTAKRDLAVSPTSPDAPTMAEAIAAAPGISAGDDLVPTPDPVDPEFELRMVVEDMEAVAGEEAVDEATLWAAVADYFEGIEEEAGTVDASRVRATVPDNERPAPSIAAATKGSAPAPAHLRGYQADLQRAFLKYGSDGVIPASSVNWLAETYDRRVVEVAHDLRQMARNAGVVIPDFERTDPPPPEPTTPAVIPATEVTDGDAPDLAGSYLHALESVLEKYDLVRLVPENSLAYLGKVHGRTAEQVKADLGSIAKPETQSVLPDYAY